MIVDDSWTPHAHEIVATKPDLVIAAVPYQEKSLTEILKSGARFLALAPKTLNDIYTDIVTIAGVVGVAPRGEEVVSAMKTEIEDVRRQSADLPRPRVFCEEWGKPLIRSQAWVAELVDVAGGNFVGTPGGEANAAAVLAEDPDVVIAGWCGAGDRVPLEKIVRDRGWNDLRAVRERRIYCVRDELLNTPAPTLVSGLRALAAAIHPERFPNVAGLKRISDISLETRTSGAPMV